jgi:hypothetical protein
VLFGSVGAETGLAQVGVGEAVSKATQEQFQAALGSLAGLVAALEQAVREMVRRPDQMEMEFRASLTGKGDLWVVSGEGEAEFKVKLAWGKEGTA